MAVLLMLALLVTMVVRGAGLALTFAYIARRNSFSTGSSLGYGVVGGLLGLAPLLILPVSIAPIVIRRRGKGQLTRLTTIDSYVDFASVGLLLLFALPVLMVFLPRQIGPAMLATSGARTMVAALAIGLIIRSLFLGRKSEVSEDRQDALDAPDLPLT